MNKDFLNVLLADDDEDDRQFFLDAFTELKVKTIVNTVNNGFDLMTLLMEGSRSLPDILFLDLNMPIKNGIDCLVEIKKNPNFKTIAIAIYSTSSSEEDIESTFVLGANVYIKKPNDFGELKKILAQVITMNWQFHTSGLNKDSFLLRV